MTAAASLHSDSAIHIMPASITVWMIGLVVGLSVAVWLFAARRIARGEHPLAFRDRPDVDWPPLVVLTALLLWWCAIPAVVVLASPPRESLAHIRFDCIAKVVAWLAVLGVLKFGGRRPWRDLGIRATDLRMQLVDGQVAFAASIAPVLLVVLATWPLRSDETQHWMLRLLHEQHDVASLTWVFASAAVVAPLVEELVFRVVIQGALCRHLPAGLAIVLTSLAFAAVHPPPDSIALLPLGLILGYCYYRRHSYLAVVVAHGLFNAANIALALALT